MHFCMKWGLDLGPRTSGVKIPIFYISPIPLKGPCLFSLKMSTLLAATSFYSQVKPNLHSVWAIVKGKPKRIKVSTKAIKQGLVAKPLKRKYGYTRQQKLEAAG